MPRRTEIVVTKLTEYLQKKNKQTQASFFIAEEPEASMIQLCFAIVLLKCIDYLFVALFCCFYSKFLNSFLASFRESIYSWRFLLLICLFFSTVLRFLKTKLCFFFVVFPRVGMCIVCTSMH